MNKIYVCSIMKNEIKNLQEWYDSCKEADEVFLLDTGSEDGSFEKAKELGINITRKVYNSWRFDVARNDLLSFLPKGDLNVWVMFLDLDERLQENWKSSFENIEADITRLNYLYIWNHFPNGKPNIQFYNGRIIRLGLYEFKHATHEILVKKFDFEEKVKKVSLIIEQFQDTSKTRPIDLVLLEKEYEDNPDDSRTNFYLAREYYFRGITNKSLELFIKYLNLPTSTWKVERADAMKFIARNLKNKGEIDKALAWYYRSLAEDSKIAEIYLEMGFLFYHIEDWYGLFWAANKALNIEDSFDNIRSNIKNNYELYDLLSIAYFHLDRKEESLEFAKQALELNKDNKRLQENIEIIEESLNQS